MGRSERPVDPMAGPVERLAWELRRLRDGAGRPSYRVLAERTHFSRSTLAEAAAGMRLPTLDVAVAYAAACGGDPAEWEARWRAAAGEVEREGRRCPYPGLAAFGPQDADLFFGRAGALADLLKAVDEAALTAVFGASGSGKSSLLRAGLLPALDEAGTPVALLAPDARPEAELDAALASLGEEGRRRVLVVDQFEEVFTLCGDEERGRFLDALTTLARDGETAVVLGVRSDFYGHCARHAGLVAALRTGVQFPLGPPADEELRDIVVEPAARVGLEVEPELVAAVLAEAAAGPGSLPLVAHALREAWARHPGDTLRLADYRAVGGVREAVARTAERLYEDLDGPRRRIVRAVLLRLTALGEGTEDTRRRLDRDELAGVAEPGEVDAVLDLLAAARLVVVDGDTVDVAHEALIGAWPRLRGWLSDDREALRARHRLTAAADDWERAGRQREFLYAGTRLALWDDRGEGGHHDLNDLERAFLAAGRDRRDADRAASRRRVRLGFGGLGLVAAVVAVLAVVALVQAGRAAGERDRAESRRLAADARHRLERDPELALLLATAAYETHPTAEAESALRQVTAAFRLRRVARTGQDLTRSAAVSPDGRRVAVLSRAGLRLWEWTAKGLTQAAWRDSTGGTATAFGDAMAFSPDGRTLATVKPDGTVRLWDVTGGGAPPEELRAPPDFGAHALAFGPQGRRLAVTRTGEVRIWDVGDGGKPVVLRVPRNTGAVAFAPDGKRLAAGGVGAPLRIWDVSGERPRAVRSTAADAIESLAFAPGGTWLGGINAGTPAIWNLHAWPDDGERRPQTELKAHEHAKGMVFSPDGRRVATYGDGDRVVRVWTTGSDLAPLELRVPDGRTRGAAFAPGGRTLTTVGGDGTVRVWDVAGGGAAGSAELRDSADEPGLVLSADGRTAAAHTLDGTTVRVWDTARGGAPAVLRGARRSASVIALSPDGKRLATGGADGTVRLWNLPGGSPRVVRQGGGGPVLALAFSADGRRLAATGGADAVAVWDVSAGPRPLRAWKAGEGVGAPEGGLALDRDGTRLAFGADDGTVVLWDVKTGDRTVLKGGPGPVTGVVLDPGGRRVAAVSEDGALRVWTDGGPAPATVARGAATGSRAVVFSPDGRWLATTEPDGNVALRRPDGAAEPVVLGGFGAAATGLAFAPGGRRLTVALHGTALYRDGGVLETGLGGGVVRTWDCAVCGPAGGVLTLAKRRATRALTPDEHRTFGVPR